MSRFRVVICGGGIAAVEGLLRLRRLVGDAFEITLVAPATELRYRPASVQEPFSRPGVRRYALRRIAQRTDAQWVQDGLEWLDPDEQVVHTAEGRSVPYDGLLVAVGARVTTPFEHVTVFDDARPDDTYHGVVQDVEGGYTRSVALLLPEGPAWPLPVYELALMTAEHAWSMNMEDLRIHLVTPEPAPLAAFGAEASNAVAELLQDSKIDVHTGSLAEVPRSRHLIVRPSDTSLEPGRIIAMPRIVGPEIRNLPQADDGFTPIDDRCRVDGIGERVFAAGDAVSFPVKQGGVGAQMADIAAEGIAALAGADIEPTALRPVIRGVLYTGREPLFLTARYADGDVESEVSHQQAWPADEKIVAEELGPFLRSLDETS
jgi:sulfide:quinone oxidoreductase